jgi:hypothetical protein
MMTLTVLPRIRGRRRRVPIRGMTPGLLIFSSKEKLFSAMQARPLRTVGALNRPL